MFAHTGNVQLLMLKDINYEVQSVPVDKVQTLHWIIRSGSHCTATVQKQNKVTRKLKIEMVALVQFQKHTSDNSCYRKWISMQ